MKQTKRLALGLALILTSCSATKKTSGIPSQNNSRALTSLVLTSAPKNALDIADLRTSGTPGDTEKYLKEAIALDKTFDRAWYNLGLLQAGENRLGAALDSLLAAEKHNPQSPDYPYARATVHYRRQEMTQAIEAIQKALGIQSDYQPALQFLQNLQQR